MKNCQFGATNNSHITEAWVHPQMISSQQPMIVWDLGDEKSIGTEKRQPPKSQ